MFDGYVILVLIQPVFTQNKNLLLRIMHIFYFFSKIYIYMLKVLFLNIRNLDIYVLYV